MSEIETKYRIVESVYQDNAGVEIMEGDFKTLVYQYGKVSFVDGKPQLNFERTIHRLPKGVTMDEAIEDEELSILMGDILVHLLEKQMNKDKEK